MSISAVTLPQYPTTPEKSWALLYAVLGIFATAIIIGGIYLTATDEGVLFINASTQINGSLEVNENIDVKNISLNRICFTPDCSAYAFHNGSGIIIRSSS